MKEFWRKLPAALLLLALLLSDIRGIRAEEPFGETDTEETEITEEVSDGSEEPRLTEDEENGFWEYRSPELTITITRYSEETGLCEVPDAAEMPTDKNAVVPIIAGGIE